MLQFNHDNKALRHCIAFVLIIFSFILFPENNVHAKSIGHYSYNNIYNNIPEAYRTSEYLYKKNGVPFVSFATYKNNDYKTSIKRTAGELDYLYCMDYSKHVDFDKDFEEKNTIFNNTLRARLAIAFYYGATTWKGQANSKFTTGNTILDYYMTQMVVHALIYQYGEEKSDYGIDYNQITFKSGTGNLKQQTTAFLKFCCNATVYADTKDFNTFNFKFKQTQPYIYLNGNTLTTSNIECVVDKINNATVKEYVRNITSTTIPTNAVSLEETSKTYDSSCKITIPLSVVERLTPGMHSITLSEAIAFNRYLASIWQSTDTAHISQEIGGLLPSSKTVKDEITFSLLIGNVTLHKTDSITGDTISDAIFQLQQFDDTTGQYVFYKHLSYNVTTKQYESGNIYLSVNNKNGRFRIIEERAGLNYCNDWTGAEFQITSSTYSYAFEAENQPILGKLQIHKVGENAQFGDSGFTKTDNIPLSGVKFGLYAKKDIYLKGKLFYPKDKKIVDLVTDSSGDVFVDDLISGEYYFKEEETNPLYEIDPDVYSFEIVKDSTGKYSEVSFQIVNTLKSCSVSIFKYYYEKSDTEQQNKLPLEGAKFGLYPKTDIKNAYGQLILAKDTLICEAVSDKDGILVFNELPYGDYYIKELEAPEGFILNDGIVDISKEEFQYDDTSKEYFCKKEILNQKQNFKIQIIKTGETFYGFEQVMSEQGEYTQYQLLAKPLQNVEFSLYNKEDDSLVATAFTNEYGVAEYSEIEPGSYYAIESAAPEAYQLSTERIYFECKADSKYYNPLEPPVYKVSVDNQLCNCKLQLFKSGEHTQVGKKGLLYDQIPLSDIVFGIYQSFEYTSYSGEKLLKDSCVGYIVTDQNGNGNMTTKLPAGTYYLKELKTNAGYDLDKNIYPFEITPNHNQDIVIQVGNENRFVNQLSKAAVQIIKTDANTGKKLKNVEFTLYNDKNEKIGVYRTNRQGKILVEQLPYGKYYFIETKCKNGYYSSNNKYHFELTSPKTITLNITNNPILQLGFAEHYKAGLIACLAVILGLLKVIVFRYDHATFLRDKKRDS